MLAWIAGCAAWAEPDTCDLSNWANFRGECVRRGANREQVGRIVKACQLRGLGTADAEQLLGPVYEAQRENLPVGCIYEKIDEGMAKGVGVFRVSVAAGERLEHMRLARTIVVEELGKRSRGEGFGPAMLVENTGMALESGLAPATVRAVFRSNDRPQIGRLGHVMEAGETLYLAGFEDRQVERVMIDFLARNLNRHEMFRAVEVLKGGAAQGRDFETIYASLWVSGN